MAEGLVLDLTEPYKTTTIIYYKILSYGFYYFQNKSIAEWFIQKYKDNRITNIYLLEEEIDYFGEKYVTYVIKKIDK